MKANELDRRHFMINSARTFLGVSLSPMLGSSIASAAIPGQGHNGGKAKAVIFLNMSGGMSHLDTFDLKPRKPEVQGPVKGISTSADFQISEYLPELAKQMHHCAVINSMNTTQGAHEQGQYILHRSYAQRGTIVHPTMGAWVLKLGGRRNKSVPGYVAVGGGENAMSPGFFGSRYAGVPVLDAHSGLQDVRRPDSVSQRDYDQRLSLADKMNAGFHAKFPQKKVAEYQGLYDEAIKLMRSKDLEGFDISGEDQGTRETYGDNRFGQGCLLARRLVERNVRYIEVSLGGWDTHYDNFTSVKSRCETLDKGLAALLDDLHKRGLLESTIVCLATEFGRTPKIVPEHQLGRDHHPRAFSCVLAGGGVNGGQKYGETDSTGARVKDKKVTPPMLNATIAHALGLPLDAMLMSPSGRPFWVSDKAPAVTELFA